MLSRYFMPDAICATKSTRRCEDNAVLAEARGEAGEVEGEAEDASG